MNLTTTNWSDLGQGASLLVQNTGASGIAIRIAAALPGAGVLPDGGDFTLLPGQSMTFNGLTAAGKHAYARGRGKSTPHTCAVYNQ